MKQKKEYFSRKITNWVGSTKSLILHTIFFIFIFSLRFFGFESSDILLILTTIVSLEAIYLSILIQITINQHSDDLEEVSEDIEELQEDVEEISEDVDEIQKDVEEISEDVDEITEEDAEEEKIEEQEEKEEKEKWNKIENTLQTLLDEIAELKKKK